MNLFRLLGWKPAAERVDEAYRRGYRYAAAELLRHDLLESEASRIDRLGMESMGGIDHHPESKAFDRGIWDALHDWNRKSWTRPS